MIIDPPAAMRRPTGNVPTMSDRFPDATPESTRQEIDALRSDRVMRLSLRDIDDQPATLNAPRMLTPLEIAWLKQEHERTIQAARQLRSSTPAL